MSIEEFKKGFDDFIEWKKCIAIISTELESEVGKNLGKRKNVTFTLMFRADLVN
jgi:hypothetical protein